MHAGNRCFLNLFCSGTLFFGFSTTNIASTRSKLRYIEDIYNVDTSISTKASKHVFLALEHRFSDSTPQI